MSENRITDPECVPDPEEVRRTMLCIGCYAVLNVPPVDAGRLVKCPKCSYRMVIPERHGRN